MKISTKKLQNIKLQITFPFASKNDENELFIYQKTIKEVLKLYKEERFYISFNRYNKGIVCIKSIVDFIHSLDEEKKKLLNYPSVQILSNEEVFENNFICITSCEDLVINLRDKENNYFELDKYLLTTPVDLKNLIICISCDIEYILI
ncbi:hypothetical protein N5T96_07250 [Aliarcobacter butzleri]|uniref:hypothetical protein n=1 Tax=Aliarcobacter butzleri TaxID=28197 RepID=UPI0021B57806|nr:hypothetical protein [Aliarcobacter butzleri]MCT7566132.1 hypothetical protein [Aliarcobacter butzleri]